MSSLGSAVVTAEAMRAERRAFVTATVVRAEKPTSAHAGDSALVLDDGTVVGFVGGECAATSVQAQALAAMDTGEPVLLRITPEPSVVEPAGTVSVHNPCLSGGTIEVFLEPWVPPALVVVHGDAPIARAVRDLAAWLGFEAEAWPSGGETPVGTAAVVVASHGGEEHAVLEAALAAGVPYVGLIASRRRGAAVLAGLDADARARVRTPAGVDIGARTPHEVALSVLAELVSVRPRPARRAVPQASAGDVATAVDPVCGMTVAMVPSSRHVERDGTTSWFCGSGCQEAFLSR